MDTEREKKIKGMFVLILKFKWPVDLDFRCFKIYLVALKFRHNYLISLLKNKCHISLNI